MREVAETAHRVAHPHTEKLSTIGGYAVLAYALRVLMVILDIIVPAIPGQAVPVIPEVTVPL